MMKEKYFQRVYKEIEVPTTDVQQSIRDGIQKASQKTNGNKVQYKSIFTYAALLFATVVTFSLAFPALAEKVPIIGSVFELFEENEKEPIIDDYANHATDLGTTKESNGVSLTFTEAVYDGENITIAFTLESEHDLGDEPFIEYEIETDYRHYTGGSQLIEKLDEGKYAGLIMIDITRGPRLDTIQFNWEAKKIGSLDEEAPYFQFKNPVEGNWSFDITLENIGSETYRFENLAAHGDGIEIKLNRMTATPISTTFYFSEKLSRDLEVIEKDNWICAFDYELKDNLGNDYPVKYNGGEGSSIYYMGTRITTTKIDEEATSLTLTPIARFYKPKSKEEQDGYGVEYEPAMEPFELESIEVPLEKTE